MSTCPVCGATLAPSLFWRGHVRSMEEGPNHCVQPHLCPATDMPPPLPPANEIWFRGQAQKPRKPKQAVAAKVTPPVPAPHRYKADDL